MEYSKLLITYADGDDELIVPFTLRDNSVVPKWTERVFKAQKQYPIDDPGRFYGFGSLEEQVSEALSLINGNIDIINAHDNIIDRRLENVNDQDTLNYLHHIFETHHGLLDQQQKDMPERVLEALADLNVCVHRCESVARGAKPRHVVTYYGLPKDRQLEKDDFDCFERTITTGTAYLNYVEIGKTLPDLYRDNDSYIGDEAFRPYNYYSADFNVKFWTIDGRQADTEYANIREYYAQHRDYFESKGWFWGDKRLTAEHCPLADIDDIGQIQEIAKRRWVKSVTFR